MLCFHYIMLLQKKQQTRRKMCLFYLLHENGCVVDKKPYIRLLGIDKLLTAIIENTLIIAYRNTI